jgi:hypothetical protein
MLPGLRNALGQLYVTTGTPPAGTPLVGGIAVSPTGQVYASESATSDYAPINTTPPVISGTNTVGSTLTCTPGTWSGFPTPTITRQWQKDGADISGSTGLTYVVQVGDVNAAITCLETATNSEGSDTKSSNVITIADNTAAPVNLTLPAVTGNSSVGSTLTCTIGTWSGNPTPTLTHQWLRDGVAISGETTLTYTVDSNDVGTDIVCAETGTNSKGSATAYSNITAIAGPTLVLDIDFLTGVLDSRITFTRASAARYTDSYGILQSAGVDQPRFDHDSLGEPLGLLMELAGTNVCLQSQTLDNVWWLKNNGASITPNAIAAPDGSLTADLVTLPATNDSLQSQQLPPFGFNEIVTISFWIKGQSEGTWTTIYKPSNNVNVEQSFPITTEWQRKEITFTNSASGTTNFTLYPGNNRGAINTPAYIWGIQVERSSKATSYMVTTNASGTRAADGMSMIDSGFSSWFSPVSGTIAAEFTPDNNLSDCFGVFGATSANLMGITGDGLMFQQDVIASGVAQVTSDISSVNVGVVNKVAFTYTANDFRNAANGELGTADTSGTVPSCNSLRVGSTGFTIGAGSSFSGHFSHISAWNGPLSDQELIDITNVGGGPVSDLIFPRLMSMGIGYKLYLDPTYQALAAQMDYLVWGMYQNWYVDGTPKQATDAIRALNPDITIVNYVIMNEVNDPPSTVNQNLVAKMNSVPWWLLNKDGQRVQWTTQYSAYETMMNQWATLDGGGLNWPQWYTNTMWSSIFQNGGFDGWYFDNFMKTPLVSVADWKEIGTNQANTDLDIAADWRTYQMKGVENAQLLQPGALMSANVNDLTDTQYYKKLDMGFCEGLAGQSYSLEGYAGWGGMMARYRSILSCVIDGTSVGFGVFGNAGDYQWMRYLLCSCLLDNGYFAYSQKDEAYNWIRIFDEYNQPLMRAIDPPQTIAWSNGVYRRRFEGGMALVNPSTSATVTVTIEPGYKSFLGTQDPTVNNGQPKTSITLKPKDGIILVKV